MEGPETSDPANQQVASQPVRVENLWLGIPWREFSGVHAVRKDQATTGWNAQLSQLTVDLM
jgi:hypothetical protein